MIARPTALGAEVKIDGLETADQVLHELAWIQNRFQVIDAEAKAKIDAIKVAADAQAFVTIDEVEVTLADRQKFLSELLAKWTEKHIDKHFEGKKRSVDLPHGKLGLRQQPLVAAIGKEENAASVLDKINETFEFQTTINTLLDKKAGVGTAKVRDLLDIKITPACKAMKDGLAAKRLTAEDLQAIGIELREAYDEPIVTPTAIIVT